MQVEHIEEVQIASTLQESPQKIWRWLLTSAIVTIILGIAAILLPFMATLALEVILAIVFLIASVTLMVHAFQSWQLEGLIFRLIMGIIYGIAGVMLLAYPVKGALTLTVLLAILFLLGGVFKIALALNLKPMSSWGWFLFSGVLSVLLGVLIWIGLPGTARWVIGMLVGIELLFSGWAMVMFAISIKNSKESIK